MSCAGDSGKPASAEEECDRAEGQGVRGVREGGTMKLLVLGATGGTAVESVAFLFKDAILPPAYMLGRLFFPVIVADASAMEKIISNSGLDWTIVRPPRLTNQPRTGMYRVREGHLPSLGFTISRADVADYMIGAIEKRTSIRRVVGVCN